MCDSSKEISKEISQMWRFEVFLPGNRSGVPNFRHHEECSGEKEVEAHRASLQKRYSAESVLCQKID